MPFSCYFSAHHGYTVLIYKIIKQTFYTSHLGLYDYPMGGAAALISRPHYRDLLNLLCTKTNYQKPGGGELIGIGIDRDMTNWEFSKTVKLL